MFARETDWIPALQRLDGEFRRDTFDRIWMRTYAVVLVPLGAWMVLSKWDDLDPHAAPFLVIPAILMEFMAFWLWRAAGARYRFQLGTVACLFANGRVLWERSLSELQSVQTYSTRGGEFLRLTFRQGRKYVPLNDALEKAIQGQMQQMRPDH